MKRATTVPQSSAPAAPTPTPGEAFNFNTILDTVMIPRCITRDASIPPGARLLWGIIRQKGWRDGICRLPEVDLADELGCKIRQLRYHLAALTRAGLLKTVQRPGSTPERSLLWSERFNGSVKIAIVKAKSTGEQEANTTEPQNAIYCRPPGNILPEPRQDTAGSLAALPARVRFFRGSFRGYGLESSSKSVRRAPRSDARRRPSLREMEQAQQLAKESGISFQEAMQKISAAAPEGKLTSAAEALNVSAEPVQ